MEAATDTMAAAVTSASLFQSAAAEALRSYDQCHLDSCTIPQERLDLANRTRTNIFPWRGQFSPQLIEILLTHFARPGSRVLDPFVGVGTTLFEAARCEMSALGVDINPAALSMARTALFLSRTRQQRQQSCCQARSLLEEILPESSPLFSCNGSTTLSVPDALSSAISTRTRSPFVRNILVNTLIRFMAGRTRTSDGVFVAFGEHQELVLGLPHSPESFDVIPADARRIPVDAQVVDLVVTSPPYINVFNYHQNNRSAMEVLGWNLLQVAKSEFGANRKHRGNRFLTVVQYCLDMATALVEMRRVLRPDGRLIVVIGRESNVRSVAFRNGEIVAGLAAAAGFDLDMRQERRFTNRFGTTICEDILHLVPSCTAHYDPIEIARAIAVHELKSRNVSGLPQDIVSDIQSAIDSADSVRQSPLFSGKKVLE